jgi:hypothetical protein
VKSRKELRANAPPAWAEAVLRILVNPRDRDMIAGDLIEEYRETVIPARGAFRARIWYCRQVWSFLCADSLARLRSATLPDCFLWATAAAIAEYALLFLLPAKTGASVEAVLVWLAAGLLVAGSASGIRTARDAWLVCRASSFWLLLFGIVTVLTARAPVFTPVPLVIAFFVIVPMAGFQSARQTGILRTGSAVGLVTGILTFLFGAVLAATLRVPHPPLGATPFPPALAAILGTLGAIFGKRFTRRRETFEATRLFCHS